MFDTQLFLGFPLSDLYQLELSRVSSSARELFIQQQTSSYLQHVQREDKSYLGKFLGASIEMAALDSLQAHIYSLLKKLIPDYPYEQHPLMLFAVLSQDKHEISA